MGEDEVAKIKKEHEAFLANISHEIRTPLNGIMGLSELLLHMDLGEKQEKYVRTIFESSETLLALVNDLLDLSAIQGGTLKVEKTLFNLPLLLEEVLILLSQKAIDKGLDLHLYYPKDVQELFLGDPVRIREILINLVGNAIKFTSRGEIILGVLANPFEIFISDTGIGIPKDLQERIFEKFIQGNTTSTRKYGGTGLGLTIAKSLVERMGGTIFVKSREGQGSVFSLQLPFEESPSSPFLFDETWTCIKGKRILIVAPSDVEGFIFSRALRYLEAVPTTVYSKDQGLEELRKQRFLKEPLDLILLDLDLSGDWVKTLMEFKAEASLHGASLLWNDWEKKWRACVINEEAFRCHFLPKPTLPFEFYRKLTELFTPSKMTP